MCILTVGTITDSTIVRMMKGPADHISLYRCSVGILSSVNIKILRGTLRKGGRLSARPNGHI